MRWQDAFRPRLGDIRSIYFAPKLTTRQAAFTESVRLAVGSNEGFSIDRGVNPLLGAGIGGTIFPVSLQGPPGSPGTTLHSELTDVTSDQHHAKIHALIGADHTATGLTVGHVLTATGATTFAFQAPTGGGVTDHGELTGLLDDDHTQYARAGASRAGTISVEANSAINQDLTTDADAILGTLIAAGGSIGITKQTGIASLVLTTANVVVGAKVIGRESLGTLAAPTAILANYPLLRLAGQGYAATKWSGDVGLIDIQSAQIFTDSAMGTKLAFYTTPLDAVAPGLAMLLDGAKTLTIYNNLLVNGGNIGSNGDADLLGIGVNSLILRGSLTMSAQSIITDTTTGLKIGTATNQKLGFFNATPVVRQSITGSSPAGGSAPASMLAAGVALGIWADNTA